MCGIAIDLDDADRIVRIRGDGDDPLSRGHICPKAVALQDIHEDPDRLRVPHKRIGDKWEPIGWDEAFDEVARRLLDVQRRHGKNSVAVYQGNPTVHNHGTMIFGQVFFRALRTKQRYSATSLDQLPHMLASLTMFGHQLLLPVPDIDRTDFFLVLGANPIASNGSLMTAPDIKKRLEAIQARGGKIVVIDPRRSETADIADEHHFIRPGTDALLLMALLNVALDEREAKLGRLEPCFEGLDDVRSIVRPYTPEVVAGPTGISADAIRKLACEFCDAKTAVAYGRVGVCTQAFGGINAWLINLLNIVTGNFDTEGGAMFTTPAIDMISATSRMGQAGHFDVRRSRVRGLPEFGGEYPAAVLAEEIDTPGDGQLKALITSAGNPVLSAPNGRRLDAALETLEFMVAIDIYINETTRHADIILPPTFALEHAHYDLAFHLLAIRNTAKYSEPLFVRPPDARHDWEIFIELTARVGGKKILTDLARPFVGKLDPEMILDFGLRQGPHGAGLMPFSKGLTLKRLKASPHGVDLGPLVPVMPDRLQTADGKIQLAPKVFRGDLPRLAEARTRTVRSAGSLALIGRRDLRTNNSWMHNSHRLVKGKPRCTLMIHPDDARMRGLEDGQSVRITSRVGAVDAPVEISDEVMSGVVSLPHGWGHDRKGIRLRVASEHAGVSVNDLTDEQFVDQLTGTSGFSGVPVTVTPLGS